MKHFSKLFLLLLAPAAAIAQPTITTADFPNVGDSWMSVSDTITVLPITPGGPNQTWNYAAQLSGASDTAYVTFDSPLVTPPSFQQAFPGANLAVYEPIDSVGVFYKKTSAGFFLDGLYSGSAAAIASGFNSLDFNPDQLLIPAPFTYNNTRNHTSKLTISFSQQGVNFKAVQYTYQTITADAHGTLITPAGTYPNTLRMKNFQYTMDTVYADLGGTLVPVQSNGPYDTTTVYIWGQSGGNTLLLQVEEDQTNLGNSSPGGAVYYDEAVMLAAPAAQATPQVQPYPNPASDLVRFPIEAEGAESLVIYDMLGKPVSTERVRGINLLTYGTSNLAAGVYSYSVQGKNGKELQKGRFSVVR